jgi:hypothetical protein
MDRRGGDEGRNTRRIDGYGDDRGRQEGGRWAAQDDYYFQGYPERFPEPRYEQRDNWGPPPPWWIEEQKRKRKADASKGRGGQGTSQGQGARGGGSSGGAAGSSAQPNKKNLPQSQGAAPAPKPKGKGKSGEGATLLSSGECFKCRRGGHFQSECTFDPLCVLCSLEGHISANCPMRGRPMLLQTYGNAIAGGGFLQH